MENTATLLEVTSNGISLELWRPGMNGNKKSPNCVPNRTLGPVSDLERHLPADWWRTIFNSLYLQTDGDVVENPENTELEVNLLLDAVGLDHEDPILDLCCGQGRHCIELAKRGFKHVTGLDRSRYLIRLARKRAKQLGISVQFHEGDARQLRFPNDHFRCVAIMGNSFGYFEHEQDDKALLENVCRILAPGGALVLDLVDGDWMRQSFEPRSWEWIDKNHFVCRERSMSSDGRRIISREVVVHAEKGVIADQFYAERLYSKEQISQLLGSVGLRNLRFHDPIEAGSTRGQDLGMMAYRMLITANVPAVPTAAVSSRPIFPDVTVILGDPRLTDRVKPSGAFAPEDLETVKNLRGALTSLESYNFKFWDDHSTLLENLQQAPPPFVLNLCDEGFGNDPDQELHVPAILDMIGVPYSGADSACLAICYNKAIVRAVAHSLDIPVPDETHAAPSDQAVHLPAVFPVLVKPCVGDGSVGITMDSVITDTKSFLGTLTRLRAEFPNTALLVQEFLSGPEYSVGLVGNTATGLTPFPILTVDYSRLDPELPPILGYESKWLPESPYWQCIDFKLAELDEAVAGTLIDHSCKLFERLGCRDYARFDFRQGTDGNIKLLEVNPNSGWCWDGKMALMARLSGLEYRDMLKVIIHAAQERIGLEHGFPISPAAGPGQAETQGRHSQALPCGMRKH